jgi:16S rRNA G966 N2-methylase RsmD
MDKLEQDVVFFDPPFGGPGYKYYTEAVLLLGERHLADIANDLLLENRVKYVMLRAPENFGSTYFESKLDQKVCCKQLLDLDRTFLYAVRMRA